jgi:hypothetical protein
VLGIRYVYAFQSGDKAKSRPKLSLSNARNCQAGEVGGAIQWVERIWLVPEQEKSVAAPAALGCVGRSGTCVEWAGW